MVAAADDLDTASVQAAMLWTALFVAYLTLFFVTVCACAPKQQQVGETRPFLALPLPFSTKH